MLHQQYNTAGRTLGILGIVLGGIALFMSFTCIGYLALIPSVSAIVLSILSMRQAREYNGNKNLGVAALVISIVATVIALIWLAVLGSATFWKHDLENKKGDNFKIELKADLDDEDESSDDDIEFNEALKDLEEELGDLEGIVDSATSDKIIKAVKKAKKSMPKRIEVKITSESDSDTIVIETRRE